MKTYEKVLMYFGVAYVTLFIIGFVEAALEESGIGITISNNTSDVMLWSIFVTIIFGVVRKINKSIQEKREPEKMTSSTDRYELEKLKEKIETLEMNMRY